MPGRIGATMSHVERLQRAIDYVESNLTGDLTIESVARAASYSLWHFQRVFSAVLGETVADYVRQRRLSAALDELTNTQTRILDIAIAYGFESQESFTRSFKSLFGVTPGQCRKSTVSRCLPLTKPRITAEYINHLHKGITMEPKYVDFPATTVVGLGTPFISIRSPDRNNHIVLPKLWQTFMQQQHLIKNRKGNWPLGLCEAIPTGERRHPDEFYYMACAEVTCPGDAPAGMVTKTIPAGRYAVFTHKGNLDGLGHTMDYIYGAWIARSNQELRDAPDLEVYGERFKFGHPDSEVDLYIPVR